MYQTRCVLALPLHRAGDIAGFVAQVVQQSGEAPSSVRVQADEEDHTAVATVCYDTTTPQESDRIINVWRGIDSSIQVERSHKINAHQFRKVALLNKDCRKLRLHLTTEVEAMCYKGVGSKGILEYLEECEGVLAELKAFVQSTREPV
jgi:hypothetical protein